MRERYAERERELGPELLRILERHEMLIVIDQQWKDHLLSIDHLKEGIGLRGYGQRDPLTEYKREAFDLFQDMAERVKASVVERLFKVQVVRDSPDGAAHAHRAGRHEESRGELPSGPQRKPGAGRAPTHRAHGHAARRWGATTPVPAARGRSTRSAATCGRTAER